MRSSMLGLLLLLPGCVTVRPGLPLTQLPKELAWCGAGPELGLKTPDLSKSTDSGYFPESVFKHCTPILLDEASEVAEERWEGTIVFGLNTDAAGHVASLCVWGGNYGNPTRYVACLAQTMLTAGYALPQNLSKQRYRVHFVYD